MRNTYMHQCGALVIFDVSNVGRLLHSDVLTESLQAFKTSSRNKSLSLVTSCYQNRDKLRPNGPLGPQKS